MEQRGAGTTRQGPPRGLLRFFLRLPIWLYRLRLGWLLGRRFVLLKHLGRKSGRVRSTVLEVVRFDPATRRCWIASGWGTRSQWYRNVIENPEVRYTIGTREVEGRAERLAADRARRELEDYGRRHPGALRNLTKMMIGERFDGSEAQFGRLAERVPVLELVPDQEGG